MTQRLKDKVAIITRESRFVLAARNGTNRDCTVREIEARGGVAKVIPCDLTKERQEDFARE